MVKLTVTDLVKEDRARERVSVIQSKTKKPVQFELTEKTRESVLLWVKLPKMFADQFMLPSRFHDRPHISTRQYGRHVRDWVTSIGLEPSAYGTHSLRRTKAAEIYRKTDNLRAVQLLLGHTKVDSTVRYLGVELEALSASLSGSTSDPCWRTALAVRQFGTDLRHSSGEGVERAHTGPVNFVLHALAA